MAELLILEPIREADLKGCFDCILHDNLIEFYKLEVELP